MKEDLTENPQKGELNFGEKFNIEQCPENDHLFCTAISLSYFYKRYMEWPIFLLSDSFME